MIEGLKVWNAVKKYLNLYHHQVVKENIDVKTVEGMSIDIIEKSLKAFEIISDKICVGFFIGLDNEYVYVLKLKNSKNSIQITKEQYDFLKEVLL